MPEYFCIKFSSFVRTHCGNLVLDTEQLLQDLRKGWKLCMVKAISKRVDEHRSATEWKQGTGGWPVDRKQHEQRKMLDTVSCWLAKIEHRLWCCWGWYSWLVHVSGVLGWYMWLVHVSGVLGLVQLIGTSVRCAGVGTCDWYICQVCWGWYMCQVCWGWCTWCCCTSVLALVMRCPLLLHQAQTSSSRQSLRIPCRGLQSSLKHLSGIRTIHILVSCSIASKIYGCSGVVVEYRTRKREVAGSTRIWSTASKLLTYCVFRPTQPPTLSGTGNE